jgi:hypothetical protein
MMASRVRIGTILIVMAVHWVLFLVFATKQRRDRQETSSQALILVPVQMPQKIAQSNFELAIAPRSLTFDKLESSPPSLATQSPMSPPGSIDWQASAAVAAEAAVANHLRKERYRNFGPRKAEPVEPTVPSIFKEPKHNAGDSETDAPNGITRVYQSEHCFTQLDFPTLRDPTDAALSLKTNLPRCMHGLGKSDADGELFKHLKKQRPLPELKPGIQSGPLPQRKDSTQSR